MLRILVMTIVSVLSAVAPRGDAPAVAVRQPEDQAPPIELMPEGVPADFPLRFSVLDIDLGRISDQHEPIGREIWFKNISENPVRVEYTADEHSDRIPTRVMPPGAEWHYRYVFHPLYRNGSYDRIKSFGVGWGDPEKRFNVRVHIRSVVVPDVFCDPVKGFLMDIPTETGQDMHLNVTGRGRNFRVVRIDLGERGEKDPLSFDIGGGTPLSYLDEPYTQVPVTIHIPPHTSVGAHTWELLIVTATDD